MTREELENETGVSARNIRYLIAEGLLPPPEGTGRAARYTPRHAAMLRAYAHAKAEGIGSLVVVGKRMAAASERSPTGVERLVLSDGVVLEVERRRMGELDLDEVVKTARNALQALNNRENR